MERTQGLGKCTLPGKEPKNPPAEILGGEEEWEVERILTSRLYHRKLQYQVKWRGWDPDPTWYPASDFKNATKRLREFHDRHPKHPGRPKRLKQWKEAAEKDAFAKNYEDDDYPVNQDIQRRKIVRKREVLRATL